jgi:hypothetical protein
MGFLGLLLKCHAKKKDEKDQEDKKQIAEGQ